MHPKSKSVFIGECVILSLNYYLVYIIVTRYPPVGIPNTVSLIPYSEYRQEGIE